MMFGNEDRPLSHKATVFFGVNFHQNVNQKSACE